MGSLQIGGSWLRVIVASLTAVAFAAFAAGALADHSVFEWVSAGEVNGNGPTSANFAGASADGSRVFFSTTEQLVANDLDAQFDIYERSGGTTKLVSAGQINGNGPTSAAFAAASADGSRVFFDTTEQLVADDMDSAVDGYERSGGTTKLVTAGQINGNGAFTAITRKASADGSRVFFETAEPLVASDTDSVMDVYQRSSGTTTLVSAGQINGNGAFTAFFQGASANGSHVFFGTAEPLVANDTDHNTDAYERSGGVTRRVSIGEINGNSDDSVMNFKGASADGSRAFFQTDEAMTADDTDTASDVYQRAGGVTTRVSAGQINGNGDFEAGLNGASTDGTRAFFITSEQLVANDTDTSEDLYERSGGTTKRVSIGQVNGNGNGFSLNFKGASADGSRVFFETNEPLVAGDHDSSRDVYEHSGGTTKRVSTGQINGNGAFGASFDRVSADGTRVFFDTDEPLVSGDTDTSFDVYERFAGKTSRISAGQINGNGAFNASLRGASADGRRVFFTTFEPLDAGDFDNSQDIYSAAVAP